MRHHPGMTDPITIAVLQNRLNAIAEEMGEAMLRTAYSQILNSSRDFSIALIDAQLPAGGAGGPYPGPCRRDALGGEGAVGAVPEPLARAMSIC